MKRRDLEIVYEISNKVENALANGLLTYMYNNGGYSEVMNFTESLYRAFKKEHKDTDWDVVNFWITIDEWLKDAILKETML